MFLKKKNRIRPYDRVNTIPMIKASICNGEQVAGFRNVKTGEFEEVMFLRNDADLKEFREMYDIKDEIEKFY
ncbi:MAG: aspartate dehydrogenase [Lachnospiraceae bacterium]|nr:aspartate dehydrogenase [Lachnospiraceae bacterium]